MLLVQCVHCDPHMIGTGADQTVEKSDPIPEPMLAIPIPGGRRNSARIVVSTSPITSAILPHLDLAAQRLCKSDRVLRFGTVGPHAKTAQFARCLFSHAPLFFLELQEFEKTSHFGQALR